MMSRPPLFLKELLMMFMLLTFAITNVGQATNAADQDLDLPEIFKNVQFVPEPDQILVRRSIKARGPVEIRFRDTQHLRAILEGTPLINAQKLYFIRDKTAEEGINLSYLGSEVQRGSFIHVIAQGPLIVTGQLQSWPFYLYLPRGSNHSGLSVKGLTGIATGDIESYKQALDLAKCLDSWNPIFLDMRTADAKQLMEQRKSSRLAMPELYPPFEQICPYAMVTYTDECNILEKDYIASVKGPLLYVAQSLELLRELNQLIPGSRDIIFYIDPAQPQMGLYSESPLQVNKDVCIHAEGDLALTGKFTLINHGLTVLAKGNLWLIGIGVIAKNSIYVYNEGKQYGRDLHRDPKMNIKPVDMESNMWEALVEHWDENGITSTPNDSDSD